MCGTTTQSRTWMSAWRRIIVAWWFDWIGRPIMYSADCGFVDLDSLLLQQDHNHLSNWSTNWKLSFNESKRLFPTVQSKSPTYSTSVCSINGHTIRNCHQHKDLGIVMSKDIGSLRTRFQRPGLAWLASVPYYSNVRPMHSMRPIMYRVLWTNP